MNKIFCKHDYKLIEGNIPVHYPDYEPIKYGQVLKCEKCGKELNFLEQEKYDYAKEINDKIEEYENAEEIVKGKMQKIAKKVNDELPEGFGFIVLSFTFGNPGQMMYVSNANREDVVKAMEEFIQKTKSNYGNDTGKY